MPDERAEAIRELVAQRCPSEEEPVSHLEAREAAAVAMRVLAWVEAQIEEGS